MNVHANDVIRALDFMAQCDAVARAAYGVDVPDMHEDEEMGLYQHVYVSLSLLDREYDTIATRIAKSALA